ncbi:MAG: Trk system potassium transporter TrkA [Acidimicrobiia bacterium]
MRIVIVGAGAVGSYLAERLSGEGQDVVVIEADEDRAAQMQERLDALVITGNGSSPAVLLEAGVARADLLIAVSNSDGANALACHAATRLGARRTVARIEDPGIREGLTDLGIDVVIDPGETAARELVALVRQGGVSELVEFAGGKLLLVGATVPPGSPMAGSRVAALRECKGDLDWVAAAVVRHGHTVVAHGDTSIRAGDHILIMVRSEDLDRATDLLGVQRQRARRVIILGSTRLAELTAELMAKAGFEVTMVDSDSDRCRAITEHQRSVLAICGDPTDPAVLEELNVGIQDAVLALTGWDEVNILGCLVAKALGAGTTVSRFNRISYVSLLGGVGIDATVSSRLLAAGAILRFVRRGRIHSVATFKDTDAEAIELEVDARSPAVGQSLAGLGLPMGAVIGGILRRHQAFVPTGATIIEPHDRLIFFALPEAIHRAEKVFSL